MTRSITQAKDAAIALKNLVEAKSLLNQDDYSFKQVEGLLLKASKHNIESYIELAKLYENHSIFDKALKWYMCKYNHSMLENEDIVKIANWHEKGVGTEIDNNMAVKLYTRVAFVNDEALKGAIRLYKDKDATYMRTLAPGLMTLDKWEDEAIKRGVVADDQINEGSIQEAEENLRALFKKDDEIIKNIGRDDFKLKYLLLFFFIISVAVMIGDGVSDYLVKLHEVNDSHWFAAIIIMLLSGGVCSFVPILIYSFAGDSGISKGSMIIGFIGGLLVPVFTGFERMGSGIGSIFILSAIISLLEYKTNIKEQSKK